MQILGDGGYAFSDALDIPGDGSGDFVFGRGWLLEIVHRTSGDYGFYSDGEEVRPSRDRFGVFYPPFTFVRAYSRDIKGHVRGVGSESFVAGLPGTRSAPQALSRAPRTATAIAARTAVAGRWIEERSVTATPGSPRRTKSTA